MKTTPEVTKRRVYFTMVDHPVKGWIRVGPAYPTRDVAASWLPFVSGAWKVCGARVAQFTARWVDGELDERSVRTLDQKFNMDPDVNMDPEVAP